MFIFFLVHMAKGSSHLSPLLYSLYLGGLHPTLRHSVNGRLHASFSASLRVQGIRLDWQIPTRSRLYHRRGSVHIHSHHHANSGAISLASRGGTENTARPPTPAPVRAPLPRRGAFQSNSNGITTQSRPNLDFNFPPPNTPLPRPPTPTNTAKMTSTTKPRAKCLMDLVDFADP